MMLLSLQDATVGKHNNFLAFHYYVWHMFSLSSGVEAIRLYLYIFLNAERLLQIKKPSQWQDAFTDRFGFTLVQSSLVSTVDNIKKFESRCWQCSLHVNILKLASSVLSFMKLETHCILLACLHSYGLASLVAEIFLKLLFASSSCRS